MKSIEFICSSSLVDGAIDPPKPAKNFIPNWYKNSSSYITDEKIPIHYDNKGNHTFKRCIPLMDSMNAGYIFSLPSDVYALNPDKYNDSRLHWGSFPIDIVSANHSVEQLQKYPTLDNFTEIFKWKFWWQIKTPPGYSCLFIHPTHRNDLPFITISGIVDTDVYDVPIEFPFLLRNDFFGKISKGTPLVQIIPFKRDSWKSKDLGFSKEIDKSVIKNFSIIGDMYKKVFWNKKDYT